MNPHEINNLFGDADLYLIDWILKEKVSKDARVLDAGAGSGRNALYFLKNGFEIQAIDANESEIRALNLLSRSMISRDVGSVSTIVEMPFENHQFDFIICSRVLHFAQSEDQFKAMLNELQRVLAPTGALYLSMASVFGLKSKIQPLENGKHEFPNGAIRFGLDERLLTWIQNSWNHEEEMRSVIFNQSFEESTLLLSPIRIGSLY